jgi:hypothetical protein
MLYKIKNRTSKNRKQNKAVLSQYQREGLAACCGA